MKGTDDDEEEEWQVDEEDDWGWRTFAVLHFIVIVFFK